MNEGIMNADTEGLVDMLRDVAADNSSPPNDVVLAEALCDWYDDNEFLSNAQIETARNILNSSGLRF